MTAGAGWSDTAFKVDTMTECAHGAETIDVQVQIRTVVIPGSSLTATIRRMRSKVVMAAFTAVGTGQSNADVEARVAAGATELSVTILAIKHSVGERSGQTFGRRAVTGRIEEAAINRVRHRAAGSAEIFQFHRQPGVAELVCRVVGVASRCITAEIAGVVLGGGVHCHITVPVITIGIVGIVEQGVIGRCREAAANR